MVTYRVQVVDPRKLQTLIIEKFETIKQFSIESRISESTIHRILKTRKLSYYTASRIGTLLDVRFHELFEVINVKEDVN